MVIPEELLKVCGVAILCSVCILILNGISGRMSFALRIGGSIFIFSVFIIYLGDGIDALSSLWGNTQGASFAAGSFSLMLKGFGIALLCKLCADICRDCGEGALAQGVESAGRVAIFSLCIPLISEILGYASELLERSM